MSDHGLSAARDLATGIDPASAAARVGGAFDPDAGATSCGRITLPFFAEQVALSWPELEFEPQPYVPPHMQALIIRHLAMSDGSEPTGDWCSFAELPDGRFYVAAFQGYTGNALVRELGQAGASALEGAIASLGGRHLRAEELACPADAAWLIPALPRVPIALLWWDGDDEFPARAELLFDRSATRHLPTDGCAVLGSWLTHLVVAKAGQPR